MALFSTSYVLKKNNNKKRSSDQIFMVPFLPPLFCFDAVLVLVGYIIKCTYEHVWISWCFFMALWDLVTIKESSDRCMNFGSAENRLFLYNQINTVGTEWPSAAEPVQRIRDVYCALAYSHLCNLIPIISYALTFGSSSVAWEMSKVKLVKFNCHILNRHVIC